MSAGVGLVVLGVVFAAGVVLFGLVMVALLPGAALLEERIDAIRARRAQRQLEP